MNGYRTEVEIYTQNTDDVRSLEVHYDPSIGYLPRYARVCGPGNPTRYGVKEMYMLDARPCKAGGFVPFEWYSVSYFVDNFPRRFPAYDHKTVLKPSYHLVGIGHYKAAADERPQEAGHSRKVDRNHQNSDQRRRDPAEGDFRSDELGRGGVAASERICTPETSPSSSRH